MVFCQYWFINEYARKKKYHGRKKLLILLVSKLNPTFVNIKGLTARIRILLVCTVGENIIATINIRNDYCAIQ